MKLFGGYLCDYVVSMRVNTTRLICNSIITMKLTENTLVETWMYERKLGKSENRKDRSISFFIYKNDGLKTGLLK